jgi:hypothetical protein
MPGGCSGSKAAGPAILMHGERWVVVVGGKALARGPRIARGPSSIRSPSAAADPRGKPRGHRQCAPSGAQWQRWQRPWRWTENDPRPGTRIIQRAVAGAEEVPIRRPPSRHHAAGMRTDGGECDDASACDVPLGSVEPSNTQPYQKHLIEARAAPHRSCRSIHGPRQDWRTTGRQIVGAQRPRRRFRRLGHQQVPGLRQRHRRIGGTVCEFGRRRQQRAAQAQDRAAKESRSRQDRRVPVWVRAAVAGSTSARAASRWARG